MRGVPLLLAVAWSTARAAAPAAGVVLRAPCPEGASVVRAPAPGGDIDEHCALPDGRLHGPRRLWGRDGQLRLEEAYREGLRHGPSTARGDDGAVIESGAWEDGARVGRWVRPAPPGGEPTVVHHRALVAPVTAPAPAADGWSLALGAPARALVPAGAIVWVLAGRALRAVDAATGAVLAEATAPDPLRATLVTGPDAAAAALTTRGEILLVDGPAQRRLHVPLGARGLAAFDAGRLVVVDGAGRLHAVDPVSGAPIWTARASWDAVPPVRLGPSVLVARARDLRAVSLGDGARRWQRSFGAPIAALAPGRSVHRAFLATANGQVHRLDASSGESLWAVAVPGLGRPIALRDDADGVVVLGADAAVRLDPDTGAERARVPRPRAAADEGDLLGTIACHADRAGLVACTTLDGTAAWAGGVGPLSLPPVRVGDAVWLAAVGGALHARPVDDPAGATALGTVEAHSPGVDGPPLALPLWTTPLPLPAWLEEADVAAAADPAADAPLPCAPERLRLDVSALSPTARAAGLVLDGFGLERLRTEAPPRFAADWEVGPLGLPRWHDAALLPWAPQVLSAVPDTEGDAAAVDALLACEGPAAQFSGTLTLFDGAVRRAYSGRITLTPALTTGPGPAPSCLLAATHAGAPLGWFSAPAALGWVRAERWIEAEAPVGWADGAAVGALGLTVFAPDGEVLDSLTVDGPVWAAPAEDGSDAWGLGAPGRALRRYPGGLPVPVGEPIWVEEAFVLRYPGPLPDGPTVPLAEVGGCPDAPLDADEGGLPVFD
jgi:hypothetical protein